jgi:hypothetical protein
MSFGEVGVTGDQVTSGYASNAHGVGHFENTRLLERMAFLNESTWSVSDVEGQLYRTNVLLALSNVPRNRDILNQFRYFRANVELTFRINTNQFYYGALMLTLFPTNATGNRFDERAVLDPTIISASSAESVVKTWKYSFNRAWLPTDPARLGPLPVYFHVDVACPLQRAKADMPDTISIQMWARFTDIELSYPDVDIPALMKEDDVEGQSNNGPMPRVKYASKSKSKHPAEDSASGNNTVDNAIEAISSVTIGDAAQGVKSLASFVTDNWGSITTALGFLFDKPDREVCQNPMIIDGSIDLYAADIPDTNVCMTMYKSRYVDPSVGRMPMTKNWTISDYARIPGLRMPMFTFTAQNQQVDIECIQVHPTNDTYKIPLDYAYLSSRQWRGSIKVFLQFFTSSFISARFVVQYRNQGVSSVYPTDFAAGLSRVINVKGDTLDTFTLPWLDEIWWSENREPAFQIECLSRIASTDTVTNPQIQMLVWVAGGDDIQFAYPRVPQATEWSNVPPAELRLTAERDKGKEREIEKDDVEAQAAIGSVFQETFPPIGENTYYDIDRGYCTSEVLGPITDMCKRYSPMPILTPPQSGFNGFTLDQDVTSADDVGRAVYAFRNTYFGAWRCCFLFRSGGWKWRSFRDPNDRSRWRLNNQGIRQLWGTEYMSPLDGVCRLTIPQIGPYPYGMLRYPNGQFVLAGVGAVTVDELHPEFLAARDDLQFGYPILPSAFSNPG